MPRALWELLTSVGAGVVLAILGWLWVVFNPRGKSAWSELGETRGLRSVAVLAAMGFLLGLGTLFGLISRNREVDLEVASGKWSWATNSEDANWAAKGDWEAKGECAPDAKLVSYTCHIVAGAGTLRNVGVEGDSFHCVWTGVDEAKEFKAAGHALCVKAALHK
jgi:hypothetical protein